MHVSCPSFIIPATRLDNIKYLKGRVGEVELLYMCSLSEHDMPDELEVQELASEDMRYNVHMPYDRDLTKMSEWEFMVKFAEKLKPLKAHTHTFHILPDEEFFKGIDWFKRETGLPVTLENGGSDIDSFDLSEDDICLDVGHMFRYGQDIMGTVVKYANRIKMFHLHGVNDGKDHLSVRYFPEDVLKEIMCFASERDLTVSVEVFNELDLKDSLIFLL